MGLLDKIKSTIGLDGGLKEKGGLSERIEPIVNGALYRGGDGRENTFRRIEPSDHFTDRWVAWDRMLDERHKKLGEDYPEVKRELVEIIKEAGMSEEEGARYEKLEKEHFGDYDKKTGIYAPKLDSRSQTKEVLGNVTPEQAKTLLQSDAHHILKLDQKERQEHYKNVQEKHGQKALEKLLAEVRKQRTKSNALEM